MRDAELRSSTNQTRCSTPPRRRYCTASLWCASTQCSRTDCRRKTAHGSSSKLASRARRATHPPAGFSNSSMVSTVHLPTRPGSPLSMLPPCCSSTIRSRATRRARHRPAADPSPRLRASPSPAASFSRSPRAMRLASASTLPKRWTSFSHPSYGRLWHRSWSGRRMKIARRTAALATAPTPQSLDALASRLPCRRTDAAGCRRVVP